MVQPGRRFRRRQRQATGVMHQIGRNRFKRRQVRRRARRQRAYHTVIFRNLEKAGVPAGSVHPVGAFALKDDSGACAETGERVCGRRTSKAGADDDEFHFMVLASAARERSEIGSTRAPARRTAQCRCGPVTRPVAPTLPSDWPVVTRSSTFTPNSDKCANCEYRPRPWSRITVLPEKYRFSASTTWPALGAFVASPG